MMTECDRSFRSKHCSRGRHFDGQIIILCIAWYTSFKLSLRDLVIMMADRGISVTHTTNSPVGPALPSRIRKALVALRSARGRIVEDGRDLYKGSRAMGVPVPRRRQSGPNGRFLSQPERDVNAAKSFLRSAMKNTRVPTKITLDAYAASHRAVREMKEDGELPRRVKVRSSQYLNNLVEQDHRRVKQRIRPMLGFKRFDNAAVTISEIELAEKIKKGQYKTGKLGGCNATMTELWNAALAA